MAEIWYGVSKWKASTYVYDLYAFEHANRPNRPTNQPTGLKGKNLHYFEIFQPIWLKLGMKSLNGRTQHVYVIYMHLSMLNGQTGLSPNQPTSLKVKNVHNFGIFQPIWLKLGMQSINVRTQHMYLICKD